MSTVNQMVFTSNELIAISTALESQIEDCQEFLTAPDLTIAQKVQINQVIQHSKSAAKQLDAIFKDSGINPQKSDI